MARINSFDDLGSAACAGTVCMCDDDDNDDSAQHCPLVGLPTLLAIVPTRFTFPFRLARDRSYPTGSGACARIAPAPGSEAVARPNWGSLAWMICDL